MEQTPAGKSEIDLSIHDKATNVETTDRAIKNLIDNLIVPYMVEEFLRLHGPAALAKSNDKIPPSQPESSSKSTT